MRNKEGSKRKKKRKKERKKKTRAWNLNLSLDLLGLERIFHISNIPRSFSSEEAFILPPSGAARSLSSSSLIRHYIPCSSINQFLSISNEYRPSEIPTCIHIRERSFSTVIRATSRSFLFFFSIRFFFYFFFLFCCFLSIFLSLLGDLTGNFVSRRFRVTILLAARGSSRDDRVAFSSEFGRFHDGIA